MNASAHQNGSGSQNLLTFNAGRMNRVGNTHRVEADARKGRIVLEFADDQMLHFYWKERNGRDYEEDLILFPDDAKFIDIPEANNPCVYALKFMSSSRILFFWMQDLKKELYGPRADAINKLIMDPSTPVIVEAPSSNTESRDSNYREESATDIPMTDVNSNVNSLAKSSQSIYADRSLNTSVSDRAQSSQSLHSANSIAEALKAAQQEQQNIDMAASQGTTTGTTEASSAEQNQMHMTSLSNFVDSSEIRELIRNPRVREKLIPCLPQDICPDMASITDEEIMSVLTSRVFETVLRQYSNTLNHGNTADVLSIVGYDPNVSGFGVIQFLRAIKRKVEEDATIEDAGQDS